MKTRHQPSIFGDSRTGRVRASVLTGLIIMMIIGIVWSWFRIGRPQQDDPIFGPVLTSFVEAESFELNESKQKAIWDAEHVTFELEAKLGRRFLAAWIDRDHAELSALLHPQFVGTTVRAELETRTHAGVSESSFVASDTARVTQSQSEFTQELIGRLDELNNVERPKFKVLRIESMGDDRWQFRLLLMAEGTTPNGPVLSHLSEHDVICHFEEESELESGPVIEKWDLQSVKLRRANGLMFREVTVEAGLADLPLPDNWIVPPEALRQYQFQMAVDDYDQDGFPDIAVMTESGDAWLLHSESGKRFTKQDSWLTTPLAMDVPSSVVCWIDYDNDGYPDMLMGNRLLHNEAGKTFRDITDESGLNLEMRPQGATVVDFDCDGLLDLYVLYQHPYGDTLRGKPPNKVGWIGDHSSGGKNQLWKNLGNGRFIDVTRHSFAGGGSRHTFAASWFFADDDHYPDVYIANDLGSNRLLRNRGNGTFIDATRETETGDYATSMGVATGDCDNDGTAEIYVANMYSKMGRRIIGQVCDADYPQGVYDQIKGSCAGNRLYERTADGPKFHDISEEMGVFGVGWAYALVVTHKRVV